MEGAYGQMLARLGVEVWIWGWAVPDTVDEFITAMGDTVNSSKWQVKPTGIIVDAEHKDWLKQRGKAAATKLIQGLKALGVPVALTSFGPAWMHGKFPWQEFAAVDFGMPQIYDAKNDLPDDYPRRSIDKWRELGFKRVVPIISTLQGPTRLSLCSGELTYRTVPSYGGNGRRANRNGG